MKMCERLKEVPSSVVDFPALRNRDVRKQRAHGQEKRRSGVVGSVRALASEGPDRSLSVSCLTLHHRLARPPKQIRLDGARAAISQNGTLLAATLPWAVRKVATGKQRSGAAEPSPLVSRL